MRTAHEAEQQSCLMTDLISSDLTNILYVNVETRLLCWKPATFHFDIFDFSGYVMAYQGCQNRKLCQAGN